MNESLGECPICRQGQLIAVKSIATGKFLVMCDDCESQWSSPTDSQSVEATLKQEEAVVPASESEVQEIGWKIELDSLSGASRGAQKILSLLKPEMDWRRKYSRQNPGVRAPRQPGRSARALR